jgi:RNA polymerase-binding transcription factor DksA
MTSFDDNAARERLVAEHQRLSAVIGEMRTEGLDQPEADQGGELSHYDQHPADTASDTFEREKDLSILESLEADLAEIEAALQRLEDGSYGFDEVTGEPIDRARLEAHPTARTNVDTRR